MKCLFDQTNCGLLERVQRMWSSPPVPVIELVDHQMVPVVIDKTAEACWFLGEQAQNAGHRALNRSQCVEKQLAM